MVQLLLASEKYFDNCTIPTDNVCLYHVYCVNAIWQPMRKNGCRIGKFSHLDYLVLLSPRILYVTTTPSLGEAVGAEVGCTFCL